MKNAAEPDDREATCDALGRLPYVTVAQAESAERTLLDMAGRAETLTDRLGVAQGLEGLVRIQRKLRPPADAALTLLRRLGGPLPGGALTAPRGRPPALATLAPAAPRRARRP